MRGSSTRVQMVSIKSINFTIIFKKYFYFQNIVKCLLKEFGRHGIPMNIYNVTLFSDNLPELFMQYNKTAKKQVYRKFKIFFTFKNLNDNSFYFHKKTLDDIVPSGWARFQVCLSFSFFFHSHFYCFFKNQIKWKKKAFFFCCSLFLLRRQTNSR